MLLPYFYYIVYEIIQIFKKYFSRNPKTLDQQKK